jgi:acyl-coenzyme A thioesterase PaaI-like protein
VIDVQQLAASMTQAVPFARTLGVEFLDAGPDFAVLALPDRGDLHNHVGGPHAGAMFTLGETASGAIVLAAFGDLLGRATPLAVTAGITYRKLAMGRVVATARLGRPAADVVAELDAGRRPEFDVSVELATEDGTLTGEMTVRWTLRPNR